MAAPDHVPASPTKPLSYQSPPRRPGSWIADRPGELDGRQPSGDRLGSPGPDQGYVVHLTDAVRDDVRLNDGEHAIDALAATGAVALKRAALFGRAPVIHDVRAALCLLGFDAAPPTGDEAEQRRLALEEAHHPHFYDRLRRIADAVPAIVLHQQTAAIMAGGPVVDWERL